MIYQKRGAKKVFGRYIYLELSKKIESDSLVIAYEPVWAIGTGETPDSSDINATHKFIKDIVQSTSKNNFTPNVLYGGSVTSKNAEVLFKEAKKLKENGRFILAKRHGSY